MRGKDTNELMKMEMTAAFAAKGRQMGQQRWREGDGHRQAAYEADLLTKALFHGQLEVLLAASASASAAQPHSQRLDLGAN